MRLFSVVIPMYNEAEIAADTARTLVSVLERAAREEHFRYEILFSDDGSTDGAGEIVREAAAALSPASGSTRVLRSEKNRGKGAAVRLGMIEARGDWRLFTDCDLAYGAEILPALFRLASDKEADCRAGEGTVDLTRARIPENCAVLIGSRLLSPDGYAGYSRPRRAASRAYLRLLSRAADFRYTDSQCGIKLFRADAAEAIFSRAETDGWAFDLEALLLADKLGFAVGEVPVRVLNHRASKIRLFRDSLSMAREAVRIRKRIGK